MAEEVISLKQAREQGLKFYFTGIPCKHGHVAKRPVYSGVCWECKTIAERERWKNKYEHCMAVRRAYTAKNKDKIAESRRERFKRDPSVQLRRTKRWALKNPEKAKAVYREARIRWIAKNPEKYNQGLAVSRARRRVRLKDRGEYKAEDVARIFKLQKGRCAYCRIRVGDAYDVDHIIPISKGGMNTKDNIQITCGKCNGKKHNKDPVDFAQSMGLLI